MRERPQHPINPHASTDRVDEALDASMAIDGAWEHLSTGQQIVAAHLSDGLNAEEVARNLGVTAQAVGQAINAIRLKFTKLGVNNL